eukprot:TRINITY_DN30231_c0_g3_i1.p1 TRINITY_DN30231_c0_g3~~TRINITY_DN30231_c0_g3_i1.p1  ORF type:complete len:964 (+),score=139.18 TRINITY_DN30231_c0_g3_i1:77-2893(+)
MACWADHASASAWPEAREAEKAQACTVALTSSETYSGQLRRLLACCRRPRCRRCCSRHRPNPVSHSAVVHMDAIEELTDVVPQANYDIVEEIGEDFGRLESWSPPLGEGLPGPRRCKETEPAPPPTYVLEVPTTSAPGVVESPPPTFSLLEDSDDDSDAYEGVDAVCLGPRRGGVSADATGNFNKRLASFKPPSFVKPRNVELCLSVALRATPFFHAFCEGEGAVEALVTAMPVKSVGPDDCIMRQGAPGDAAFIILSGAAACFDASLKPNEQQLADGHSSMSRGVYVRTMMQGRFFGEMAMLWNLPRSRSVYALETCQLAELGRDTYQNFVVHRQIREREDRAAILRGVKYFSALSDEHIALLVDVLEVRQYDASEDIIKQGEDGYEMYIVMSGECVCLITTGTDDVQEHKRYFSGELFGERALLQATTRAATIRAVTDTTLICLSRSKFERLLGPLGQLHEMSYLTDPRKCIADFYAPGDHRGPAGVCKAEGSSPSGRRTDWFAVYRPTSRTAIAKMLNSVAVGKGLNVKGKSAKSNRLSGFVPFLQISENCHKDFLEKPEFGTYFKVFLSTKCARHYVLKQLAPLMKSLLHDVDADIGSIDDYDDVFGLTVPEEVVHEAFIIRPDIRFLAGWETGRKSEPAFMNMNLHALREKSEPEVVLYQTDSADPMNPHGLVIAYAEASVKPVVSDFDSFLIGSRGMDYDIPLPPEQVSVACWCLDRALDILQKVTVDSWTTRWLEVLQTAQQEGFSPAIPKLGFGDATSYRLIAAAIDATRACGAVRHGAECFNFFFPQELDDEYLVVWDQFPDKPWEYKAERELRLFLLDRIREGFSFPLNPVWAARDPGWYAVFDALRCSKSAQRNLHAWYPPESGIMAYIDKIHRLIPRGFSSGRKSLQGEDIDTDEISDIFSDIGSPRRSSLASLATLHSSIVHGAE